MVSLDNFWQSRQLVQATAKPCCDSRCSFVKYLLRIKIKALMRYRCERMESVRRLCYRPHPVPRAAHHTQIFRSLCKIVDKIKKMINLCSATSKSLHSWFPKKQHYEINQTQFQFARYMKWSNMVLFHVHMPIFDSILQLMIPTLDIKPEIYFLPCLLTSNKSSLQWFSSLLMSSNNWRLLIIVKQVDK